MVLLWYNKIKILLRCGCIEIKKKIMISTSACCIVYLPADWVSPGRLRAVYVHWLFFWLHATKQLMGICLEKAILLFVVLCVPIYVCSINPKSRTVLPNMELIVINRTLCRSLTKYHIHHWMTPYKNSEKISPHDSCTKFHSHRSHK